MRVSIYIASAFAGLLLSTTSFGQHLGDVICKADAIVAGTVAEIRRADEAGNAATTLVTLGVDVTEVLVGSVRGARIRLQSTAAARLQVGARRVFLLSAGKLLRIEPAEHATIAKRLASDPTTCKKGH